MGEELRPFDGTGLVILGAGPQERLQANLVLDRTPGFEAGIVRGCAIDGVLLLNRRARLEKLPSGLRRERRREGMLGQSSLPRVLHELFRGVELFLHGRSSSKDSGRGAWRTRQTICRNI